MSRWNVWHDFPSMRSFRAQLSESYLRMFLFPCLPSDACRKLFPRVSLHALFLRAAFQKLCAHVPLPVPSQRCFLQIISTIFPPLRSFRAQLSASYLHMFLFLHLFPSYAFRKFSLNQQRPAVRYRGPTGSETKQEPKHRRCFWGKIVY